MASSLKKGSSIGLPWRCNASLNATLVSGSSSSLSEMSEGLLNAYLLETLSQVAGVPSPGRVPHIAGRRARNGQKLKEGMVAVGGVYGERVCCCVVGGDKESDRLVVVKERICKQ